MLRVKEIEAKSILNKSKIFDYCVNPYTGCQISCPYCYARLFMRRYSGHEEAWGDFVDIKINAPQVLKRQLMRAKRGIAMKNNGVILAKIEIIEETLRELRKLEELTAARLENNFFLKRGVERSLQLCVDAVVDIAHRIVSLEDRPPCSTAGKALEAIQSLGVIADVSAYRQMVQFRKIVVHQYESVDNEVLVGIIEGHLGDFDRFMDEVRRYVQD